jgi:hypothetical protein
MGNKASEEDRGQPDTEHDNPEPPLDMAVGKESTDVVPGQKKKQIARGGNGAMKLALKFKEEFLSQMENVWHPQNDCL